MGQIEEPEPVTVMEIEEQELLVLPVERTNTGVAKRNAVNKAQEFVTETCVPVVETCTNIDGPDQTYANMEDPKTCVPVVETYKNMDDPADWPNLNNMTGRVRDFLIMQGPRNGEQPHDNYPKDALNKRCFSNAYFSRTLQNGERVQRRWLLYSQKKNSAFCFCCKLFSETVGHSSSLSDENGNKDWQSLSHVLKRHESSVSHMAHYSQWVELENRLKSRKTIDAEHQKEITRESSYWRSVVERLIAIVQYLAEHNLAFRGSKERLFEADNGNFLGLVQLLGKFDLIMQEHIRRVTSNETRTVSYVGKHIQNELIQLLGNRIKNEILQRLKEAKYYSIILDCTPDISRQEQLSLVIRFVDLSQESNVTVSERFLGFLIVDDSTGKGLAEIFLNEIEMLDIPLANCRGQGYDNGANMKGQHSGVQKRILEKNRRAYFVPCGCHSLNLVLSDAAKSSVDTVTLFGIIQRIYVLFSASVNRWSIFKDHVSGLTVKPLSATRWESRIDAVKVFRYELSNVRDALVALANDSKQDDNARSEALSLVSAIEDWKFILSMVTWYEILFRVNITSKEMQDKAADLSHTISLLSANKKFLEKYRKNAVGFTDVKITAKELAEELGVEPVFKPQRIRRKKKHFDYENADETPIDAEEMFKTEFFIPLLDVVLQSITERFEQLSDHCKKWEIIYKFTDGVLDEREKLKKSCQDLQKYLTDKDNKDVDGSELHDEIICLKDILPSHVSSAKSILHFIHSHSLQDLYPNIWIALRIFLTCPVSVASAERSFSKLKLIKTYLRSTMNEERLSSLAIISIENDLLAAINTNELITEFAHQKSRKVPI